MRSEMRLLLTYSLIAMVTLFGGGACDWEITDAGVVNASTSGMDSAGLQPAGVLVSGSSSTPHWRHLRTSIVDYRINHLSEPQRTAEYNWAAARYDRVTGGQELLTPYKSRNPTIRHFVYETLWFTPVAYAGAAEAWLAARGYNVENAYLHKAGTSKTRANRVKAQQYAGRDYWYYNLRDPGFKAWRAHRAKQLSSANGQGYRSESFFFDSSSNSTIRKYIPAVTLEHSSHAAYFADYHALLTAQRASVPARYVVVNQAQYFTKPDELVSAAKAGGIHTEYGNTPYGRPRWNEIDQSVANGVTVHMATGVSPGSKGTPRGDMNRGHYANIAFRVLMWEYCSYLMVVNPNRMDAIFLETYGINWGKPFSVTWLRAFEVDLGLALAKRSIWRSGVDGAGQRYEVYKREFSNKALVLIRGQKGTSYGDKTAVTVPLPAGTWRKLRPDGTLGAHFSSVRLRNSESIILFKQ